MRTAYRPAHIPVALDLFGQTYDLQSDASVTEVSGIGKVSIPARYMVAGIPAVEGKAFVKEFHYSHGIHNGPTCYGLLDRFDANRLVGVLAIATPCSENVRRSVFGPEHVNAVTELHRLVLHDEIPHNSESYFIAAALRLHKRAKPHTWAVVSFADATEGHVGTIYQATNAIYTGSSGRATFYLDQDGRLRHPRQCGVNITPATAAERGWTPVKREGKHRYLFLLPDNRAHRRHLIKHVRLDSLPYPKGNFRASEEAA